MNLRDLANETDKEPYQHILDRFAPNWGKYISSSVGWRDLVIDTDKKLAALDENYTIYQIKSKFGGLRYYFQPSNEASQDTIDKMDLIVQDAENKSLQMCEVCGGHGERVTDDFWVWTLCDGHAKLANGKN